MRATRLPCDIKALWHYANPNGSQGGQLEGWLKPARVTGKALDGMAFPLPQLLNIQQWFGGKNKNVQLCFF